MTNIKLKIEKEYSVRLEPDSVVEVSLDEIKDEFKELMLRSYGSVEVCGYEMDQIIILERLDSVAFNQMFLEYIDCLESELELFYIDGRYYTGAVCF